MDNKTWVNLGGSSGTGRSLQALQHQQLSATASAGVYPGTPSPLAGHSAAHWQRVTYCGAVNGLVSSQSHLLSQHQQNQHSQQQQAPQLRYFQVSKPAQYPAQSASSASGSLQQHNQTHQHHFAQHYAVVGANPALSSVSSALNNPTIPERSSARKRETVNYSSYFTNQFQSTDRSAQVLNFKSVEEGQYNHPNQWSNRQDLSPPSQAYRPRYKILTSGNFLIPATVQVSLTTCFAPSSNFNNPGVEATSFTASSSLVDQVSLLPTIIPASVKSSLPRFVNAFEAVPDMLRDIRPGNATVLARSSLTTFPVSQEEFSYHASKPRLSVRVENSVLTRVENLRDKNWPELNFKCHRAVASIIDRGRLRGISAKSEKSAWKKITSIEEIREQKNLNPTHRHQEKLQRAWFRTSRSSEKLKTYADAVQVTGRHRSSSAKLQRKLKEGRPIIESDSSIMNLRENRRPSKLCPSFFHTSTPKADLRGVRKKREYQESGEEDNEHSSTSTASNGSYYGRSRTPESSSSLDAANLKNWKGSSSSSLVQEMDEDNREQFEADERNGNVPSRKRLCKMAEMFCFGQLENAAFFRAFDEYNRRRRRMSYTQKLEDGPEVDTNLFRKAVEAAEAITGEVTLVSSLTLERKRELFGNDTPRYQSRGNEGAMMSPIRISRINGINGINGMEDQGAFKVLQKLKECADGTGAIYTNSWRPEELHFLRRCYRDKNI